MSRHPEGPPELVTERLRLRRFVPDDAEFALGLHANPDLVRFLPHAALTTLDEAQAWIERTRLIENPERPLFGWWLVELRDGTPVATVVLKPIPASAGYTQEDVEIGWRQHADHTGRGYVTEAAALVLERALAAGLPRVVAVTDPANVASQRVCERLGMDDRGLTDAYYDRRTRLFVRAARAPSEGDEAGAVVDDPGSAHLVGPRSQSSGSYPRLGESHFSAVRRSQPLRLA